MIEILGLYKRLQGARESPYNLVFIFQVENGLHGKVKTSNIFDIFPQIFLILSPRV